MPPALAREKYEKKFRGKNEKNATCTRWLQSIHENKMKKYFWIKMLEKCHLH